MIISEKSRQALLEVIRKLNNGADLNESAKRHILNLHIREVFPEDENRSKIDEFAKGAEKNIKVKTSDNRVKEGFQDVDLGTVTLEWKRDLKIKKDKKTGEKELRQYISGKWNRNGYSDNYLGVLTDGLEWIAYSAKCNITKDEYNEDDVELLKIDKINVKDESQVEFLYDFLYKYLILSNKLVINPQVLQDKFGENSEINKESAEEIKKIVKEVIENDSYVLKYINMWNVYKQYNAELTNEESIITYSQNLYLVLLTRVLVARLLGMDNCDVDNNWIKQIINGTKFTNNFKIKNFVQEDMYYWILEQKYIDKFIGIAKKLYFKMSEYDFINTNKDNLLHLIYEEIIPSNQRKKYGQKSTDFRLGDNIISRLDKEIEVGKKYIEPSIGSGSLARSLILNLRSKMDKLEMDNEKQLELLQNSVIGIDIDPIAIILAKSEWIITNADLIRKSKKSIEIPIYHADSLFDNSFTDDESKYLILKLEGVSENVIIEKDIITDINIFDKYLNDCDNLAKILIASNEAVEISESNMKFANKYINSESISERKLFLEATKKICQYLLNRRKEINNGIWKGLLLNNNIPQLLFRMFDMMIANLPWLALSSLPDVEYKEELNKLSVHYKIRATESSHHHQEIATVFALRCIDKYLNENGVVSFIMPGTIISGDQHFLFRKRNFNKIVNASFEELWYIPNNINPFNVKSCVIFMRKNKKCNFKMRRLESLSNWEDVQSNDINLLVVNNKNTWTTNDGKYIDIDNYYAEKFKQGADLMPRTAVFIQSDNPIEEYECDDELAIHTDDYALNNKNGKKLKNKLFMGLIRKKYVYTTTISEMLLPYYICNYSPKIALPIEIPTDNNELEKIRFVSNMEMIVEGDKSSAEWFTQFDELEEFSKKDFRSFLNVRNKLLDQSYFKAKYIVHMGASGKYPCAAVQDISSSELKFIADQTTYVAEIYDEYEAYYIVGMLNSGYISKSIEDFQAEGAFDRRHIHKIPFVFIPQYDCDNKKHVKIAQLSKELSEKIGVSITEQEESIEYDLKYRRMALKKKYSKEIEEIENIILTL